jgi:hypothetical protein
VDIIAKITDNSLINKQDIIFNLDGNSLSNENFEFIDNIFRYTYKSPDNLTDEETHTFKLIVKDSTGLTAEFEDTFTYSDDTIYLALPESGDTVKAASDIKFGVKTDVWRVYYTVNDGQEINATQQTDREDFYTTSPEYQGWVVGENVKVNVSAMVVYNFENHFLRDEKGNLLVDNSGNAIPRWYINYINDTVTYNFDVADESSIGQKEIEKISLPKARIVAAPGFELLVFFISFMVVFLIFKYRKKNRSNKK